LASIRGNREFSSTPTCVEYARVAVEEKVTVKDNKITAWVVEPTEGAGLMAILKPLEVEARAA